MNKLREKFEKIKCYNTRPIDLSTSQIDECEQITDEFSVKFAEWVSKSWILDSDNIGYSHIYKDEWNTTTELLQIFKNQYYGKE